jgi:glutamine amidotransferase
MKSGKIVVVDYGIGNLFSVRRAVEYCGACSVSVTSVDKEILSADKLILPGVGAFGDGMSGLRERELVEPIIEFAKSGKQILGICLGMQLLLSVSEEFGEHQGLNLIPGRVVPIPKKIDENGAIRKIPFIGWTKLSQPYDVNMEKSHLNGLGSNDSIYLVHSYHVEPESQKYILATYDYSGFSVTAAIFKENIVGYQFHPEKSGPVGLKILNNFIEY